MNKVTKMLKEYIELLSIILITLPSLIILFIVKTTSLFEFINKFTNSKIITSWLLIISWLILLILISIIVIMIMIKKIRSQGQDSEKYLKFSIWWDKRYNPYCPTCGKPMIRWERDVLACPDTKNCQTYITLIDDNNNRISVNRAIEQVRSEI